MNDIEKRTLNKKTAFYCPIAFVCATFVISFLFHESWLPCLLQGILIIAHLFSYWHIFSNNIKNKQAEQLQRFLIRVEFLIYTVSSQDLLQKLDIISMAFSMKHISRLGCNHLTHQKDKGKNMEEYRNKRLEYLTMLGELIITFCYLGYLLIKDTSEDFDIIKWFTKVILICSSLIQLSYFLDLIKAHFQNGDGNYIEKQTEQNITTRRGQQEFNYLDNFVREVNLFVYVQMRFNNSNQVFEVIDSNESYRRSQQLFSQNGNQYLKNFIVVHPQFYGIQYTLYDYLILKLMKNGRVEHYSFDEISSLKPKVELKKINKKSGSRLDNQDFSQLSNLNIYNLVDSNVINIKQNKLVQNGMPLGVSYKKYWGQSIQVNSIYDQQHVGSCNYNTNLIKQANSVTIGLSERIPEKFLCQKIRGDRSLFYSIQVHTKHQIDEEISQIFCISDGFELPDNLNDPDSHQTYDKMKQFENKLKNKSPLDAIISVLTDYRSAVKIEQVNHDEIYSTQKGECDSEFDLRTQQVQDTTNVLKDLSTQLRSCEDQKVTSQNKIEVVLAQILEHVTKVGQMRGVQQQATNKKAQDYKDAVEAIDEAQQILGKIKQGDASFVELTKVAKKMLTQSANTNSHMIYAPIFASFADLATNSKQVDDSTLKRFASLLGSLKQQVQAAYNSLTELDAESVQAFHEQTEKLEANLVRLHEQVARLTADVDAQNLCMSSQTALAETARDELSRNQLLLDQAVALCQTLEKEYKYATETRRHELKLVTELEGLVERRFAQVEDDDAQRLFNI